MPCFRSFALLLVCGMIAAADWPQWLGPNRDGSTAEKVAPWKQAPKVLWRKPVGEGHSSPVVAGGKVFVHARVAGKDREEVVAFDAKDGSELWRTAYDRGEFANAYGAGPRATPAVAGNRVYTFGVTGILSCFTADKGEKIWQENTLKKFKAKNLFFGASCSPLVDDNKVFVNVGGKGASLVAFSADKGEVAWKALDDGASYSSPIAFGQGKERQVVFLTAANLVGLSPADGTVFWKFPLVDKLTESSTTPVKLGDFLLGSSVTYGSVGLTLGTKDGKPTAAESWKNPILTCYFSTPVAVAKEHVYMVTGALLPPSATLRCVEMKTGKELWNRPRVGKYHASLLRTGDNKFLLLDDSGNLILLEPSLKEYKELARSKIAGETWAHPALSDGKLYVRDAKELICLEMGK